MSRIDVSKYFKTKYDDYGRLWQVEFIGSAGELYSQLQQLKQENERLLEIINNQPLKTVDMDSAFEIAKLKQENEKLKKQLADKHLDF